METLARNKGWPKFLIVEQVPYSPFSFYDVT